jgi:hypothetical protein
MGNRLRLEFATRPGGGYPDLTGDQVSQNLRTRPCRARSPGASVLRPLLAEFYLREPLNRLKRVMHYSRPTRWALTLSIRICAP